jgi:hypothetical protein
MEKYLEFNFLFENSIYASFKVTVINRWCKVFHVEKNERLGGGGVSPAPYLFHELDTLLAKQNANFVEIIFRTESSGLYVCDTESPSFVYI